MPGASSYDYASKIQDINRLISYIANRDTPLLNEFLDLSDPVKREQHEWINKPLMSFKDTLKVAITSTTATTITVNGGTATGQRRYIPGLTMLDIADERLLVASVITVSTNYTALNVARNQLSTTPVTAAVNTQVFIVSASPVEGFDASRDDSQKGVKAYNNTQIFKRELILTGTSQAIDTVGNETMLNTQAKELTPEIMKELQYAMLHELRDDGSGTGVRRMGGLKWFAQQTGGINNENMQNAELSYALIESVMAQYFDKGGDANKLLMIVPVTQQRKINQLKEARIIGGGQQQSDNAINNFADTYQFGTKGNAKIWWTTDLKDDEIYFVQKDKIRVRPLKGRTLDRVPLGKTGDNVKELILGEYTMEVKNPGETLYRKYNLSTSLV